MEKCKSFTGDMNMDMKMGMSDGTEEQEISITMGGSLEATTDPVITHMDVTMDMLGMSVDMDVYAQVEGEKTTTYTGVMGSWTKTEQETPDTAAMENLYTIAGDGKNMTLAEKTEKIGDREAYVLSHHYRRRTRRADEQHGRRYDPGPWRGFIFDGSRCKHEGLQR